MINKKILFPIFLGLLILLVFPMNFAIAQLHDYGSGLVIQDMVPAIEEGIGLVFGAFAVVCFLIYGILFLTAQGAPEKLTTARAALIWGFVGVAVGIIAFSIVAIVGSFLTTSSY